MDKGGKEKKKERFVWWHGTDVGKECWVLTPEIQSKENALFGKIEDTSAFAYVT